MGRSSLKIWRKFPSGEEALIKRWPLGVEWSRDAVRRWFKGEYEGSSHQFRCKKGKVWRVFRLKSSLRILEKFWKKIFYIYIYFLTWTCFSNFRAIKHDTMMRIFDSWMI